MMRSPRAIETWVKPWGSGTPGGVEVFNGHGLAIYAAWPATHLRLLRLEPRGEAGLRRGRRGGGAPARGGGHRARIRRREGGPDGQARRRGAGRGRRGDWRDAG